MSKFYGIGVGPGDEDLITYKAVKTIKNLDLLFVPQSKEGKPSLAQSICFKHLKPETKIIEKHFPMTFDKDLKSRAWDEIALEIKKYVELGKNVGFVTLGDPMTYSTYIYLLNRLIGKISIETIPGITSYAAIASSNNFPLVIDQQKLTIVPCTIAIEDVEKAIIENEAIVLMKVYKNFKEVINLIQKHNLEEKSLVVSNATLEDESICNDLQILKEKEKISYFTTILINK